MRSISRLICTIFIVLVISLCCLSPVASEESDNVRKKIEVMGKKISKVTSDPKVRKYFSGALLGSAFAATVQPFKNAKDHFLVWDFKTSSRRGIFIAMKHIAHEHGVLSLFKGVTFSTLIFAPLFAVFAGNYDIIKEQSIKVAKMFKKDDSPEAIAKREADARARVDAAAKAKAEKEANTAQLKAEQEKRATEAKKKVEEEQRKREEAKLAAEKLKQEQEDAAKKAAEDAKSVKEAESAKAQEEAAADEVPTEQQKETSSSEERSAVENTESVVEEVAEELVDATAGEKSINEDAQAQA